MSLRERRDGEHIGPKRTISAASVAEMLGLKDAPPPEPPLADTPAAARLRSEGKAKQADAHMEAVKDQFAMRTVPPGREAMAALGIRAEELPVGVEAEMGPPLPKPKGEEGWQADGSYDGAVNGPAIEFNEQAADELRAQFRSHQAKLRQRAEAARGDAAKEAKIAAEIREATIIGEKIKAKLEAL